MRTPLIWCGRFAAVAGMALMVAACGGGGYGSGGGMAAYTVGGTVTGLVAGSDGVALQDDHTNNTTVTNNGAFTFSAPLSYGMAYNVTVLTNPASPVVQACTVANASGTIGYANVTNVAVTC